jgi:hypothetical protein
MPGEGKMEELTFLSSGEETRDIVEVEDRKEERSKEDEEESRAS